MKFSPQVLIPFFSVFGGYTVQFYHYHVETVIL